MLLQSNGCWLETGVWNREQRSWRSICSRWPWQSENLVLESSSGGLCLSFLSRAARSIGDEIVERAHFRASPDGNVYLGDGQRSFALLDYEQGKWHYGSNLCSNIRLGVSEQPPVVPFIPTVFGPELRGRLSALATRAG